MPSWKERLASLEISSTKTVGQAFSSEVGTKSRPEDLADEVDNKAKTSEEVTVERQFRAGPECIGSVGRGCVMCDNLGNLLICNDIAH